MFLRVQKNDSGCEAYLHTKVIGTLATALGEGGYCQEGVSEYLAEAVTFYITRQYGHTTISSDEIHAILLAVLSDTGFEKAATVLHEHRLMRQIRRQRVEVIHVPKTAEFNLNSSRQTRQAVTSEPWNKSILIWNLEKQQGLSYAMARVVAGMVEERVLRLECRQIFSTVIESLVENELWLVRKAEKALSARRASRSRQHHEQAVPAAQDKLENIREIESESALYAGVGASDTREVI